MHWGLLAILALAMGLDVVSGLIKAYNGKSEKTIGGKFASGAMRKGGLNKCLVLLVTLAIDSIFSYYAMDYIVFAVYAYYIYCEAASLNENMVALGVGLPEKITNLINKVLDNLSEKKK